MHVIETDHNKVVVSLKLHHRVFLLQLRHFLLPCLQTAHCYFTEQSSPLLSSSPPPLLPLSSSPLLSSHLCVTASRSCSVDWLSLVLCSQSLGAVGGTLLHSQEWWLQAERDGCIRAKGERFKINLFYRLSVEKTADADYHTNALHLLSMNISRYSLITNSKAELTK